jgi:membrane-anchored protein YejM (alkaline phosphatase superfamily)
LKHDHGRLAGHTHAELRRELGVLLLTLDELVGRVVDALAQHAMADNTVILFMSDNGAEPANGASAFPWRGSKRSLWEGAIKSASFIHFPASLVLRTLAVLLAASPAP